MSFVLAILCCVQVQVYEAYETRQPKNRERMLEYGGGSKETDAAVAKALAWLAKAQKPDGSWETPEADYTVGVCSLALLAFLGAGHTPKSEEYGAAIRASLKFLVSAQDNEGCVGIGDAKYLYGHALATAAFAEALAMSGTKDLQGPAQKAVDFLVAAQNPGKGWRYSAKCGDNDTSVTAWAVQALSSVEEAGPTFPKTAYTGATAWLDQVTEASGLVLYHPSVHKMIPGPDAMFDWHETPTAMAILSRLQMSKRKSDPRLAAGARILAKDLPRWEKNAIDYCYWHYGTLALFRLEGPSGETWKAWNAALKPVLIKNQVEAGAWDPVDRWCTRFPSRVYATAINALTLETYYRYVKFFGEQEK